jgi:aspartate/glutamate racemase
MPGPIEKYPKQYFMRFKSPDEHSPAPAQWAKDMLKPSIGLLSTRRRKIVLFDPFPPQYVDYYKALQSEIAKRIPEEQDRPLICLNIKGRKRIKDTDAADIGMAGGTGPLSDATALENLVRHMSGAEHGSLGRQRERIAQQMENFSAVMYSMPPFRDVRHTYNNFNTYRRLYRNARENIPCSSLHILTNTGHSNKSVFDNQFLFGTKELGQVDDMTVKVAQRIRNESTRGEGVLILGTLAADKAKLYPKLLAKRELNPILPNHLFEGRKAKEYLQLIINQAKSGKITENMPNESRTCGQAFIDFTVHFAKASKCRSLLFSCTELPMLLHTKIPMEDRTYLEKLQDELNKLPNNIRHKYYDSEEIFVEEMAKKSIYFQRHPEQRSTGEREDVDLNMQLTILKDTIEKYSNSFIKGDEKAKHKRNVMMALLQYFEDGDLAALQKAKVDNPRYVESVTRWGSTALSLVEEGEALYAQINPLNPATKPIKSLGQYLDQRYYMTLSGKDNILDKSIKITQEMADIQSKLTELIAARQEKDRLTKQLDDAVILSMVITENAQRISDRNYVLELINLNREVFDRFMEHVPEPDKSTWSQKIHDLENPSTGRLVLDSGLEVLSALSSIITEEYRAHAPNAVQETIENIAPATLDSETKAQLKALVDSRITYLTASLEKCSKETTKLSQALANGDGRILSVVNGSSTEELNQLLNKNQQAQKVVTDLSNLSAKLVPNANKLAELIQLGDQVNSFIKQNNGVLTSVSSQFARLSSVFLSSVVQTIAEATILKSNIRDEISKLSQQYMEVLPEGVEKVRKCRAIPERYKTMLVKQLVNASEHASIDTSPPVSDVSGFVSYKNRFASLVQSDRSDIEIPPINPVQ